MSEPWTVELTGPARRALEKDLPEAVAWAAYSFITERFPSNPHRLGGELSGPFVGYRSAHLGTYRVGYRIEEAQRSVYVLSIRLRGDVYGVRSARRGRRECEPGATVCYMRTVTHREMRNSSGEILRAVAAGETVQVTNNGRVAAVISPPLGDTLARLEQHGQVRPARRPVSALSSIRRRKPRVTSEEIVKDVRGRW